MESRGNFFQKVSFGASPLRRFLFASFSFVPTCSKEKEELWNLMTEWKEYLFSANFTLLQSLRRCRAGSLCWGVPWVCANIAKSFTVFAGRGLAPAALLGLDFLQRADIEIRPYGVRFSPNRGVMRLWRCAPAPYRVCINLVGAHFVHRRGGFHILPP